MQMEGGAMQNVFLSLINYVLIDGRLIERIECVIWSNAEGFFGGFFDGNCVGVGAV